MKRRLLSWSEADTIGMVMTLPFVFLGIIIGIAIGVIAMAWALP